MKYFFSFLCMFFHLSAYSLTITSDITTITEERNIEHPHVKISEDGKGMVVWTSHTSVTEIQAAYFNGTHWLQSLTISRGTFPRFGIALNGVAFAVWLNTINTSAGQIFVSQFDPLTNSWSQPIQISNGGINAAPDIAVNAGGNAVAVWIQNYPTSIQAATYDASTSTWSEPKTLINKAVISPKVTLNEANQGIVMWRGRASHIETMNISLP
ncbi:MAG: hypothetical protein R3E91_01980 [Chlamydiales bacterium]